MFKTQRWMDPRGRIQLVALAFLFVASAEALEFSSEQRVYQEDFAGETGFPTTPEIDTIGAGSLVGFQFDPSGASGPGVPLLSGGAARFSIGGNVLGDLTSFSADALASADFALRGDFENLQITGEGVVVVGVAATLTGSVLAQPGLSTESRAPSRTVAPHCRR